MTTTGLATPSLAHGGLAGLRACGAARAGDDADDPAVIVVEYELTGTVLATGVRAAVTCIAVLGVRDGVITHWREFQVIPVITEGLTREPSPSE